MAKKTPQIPTKIVDHIAQNALYELRNAIGEAKELARLNIFIDRNSKPGIDMAVLQEKLESADKLIELLCSEDLK